MLSIKEARIYVVHDELCQCILDELEEEGYLVDVDECPFGYCSSGSEVVTGIDANL